MVLDNTYDIVSEFDECLRIEDILRLTLNKTKSHGVDFLFFGLMPQEDLPPQEQLGHVLFSNIPGEWANRYFWEGHLKYDPVIDHVRRRQEALNWVELSDRGLEPRQKLVMAEAQSFKMYQGITIPHLSLDGVKIGASFSGEKIDPSPEVVTKLNVLSAVAVMRAISIGGASDKKLLTQRERECLLWVADGKSDWEVSVILGISHKTVEKHLTNCKMKLNATNRVQAIVKAIAHGVIS